MKPGSRKHAEWEQSIGRVTTGMTKAEVEMVLGPVSRPVHAAEPEILAYREERIGGAIYSIRVAFNHGLVSQCYLAFELGDAQAAAGASRAVRCFQLFLIILVGAVAALIYAWFATR